MIAIPMRVAATMQEIPMQISASNVQLPFKLGASYAVISGEAYDGSYNVTPSTETQVLYTKDKVMQDNVTIAPIPSDWGHITWNGSVLTVS